MHKIEICIVCAFVHRDDRTNTRQKKSHYHWKPNNGEITIHDSMYIHATICCACISSPIDWTTYAEARNATDDQWYIPESYNASLPKELHTPNMDTTYYEQVEALKLDSRLHG